MEHLSSIKHLLYSLIIFGMTTVVNAQDKQIEAIAAFQMAEEQFNTSNYSQALDHVETAKNALGIANSKILYLQIQILNEMGKTDSKYIPRGLETIKAFEKAPDISQFSQEKRVEVAKMKISMNRTLTELESAKKQLVELNANRDQAISAFFTKYPKVGIHFDDYLLHPHVNSFKEATSGTGWKRQFRRGTAHEFGESLFTYGDQGGSFISGISTNDQGIVEAYIITAELNNSSDSINLELLGFNQSVSELLIRTNGKKMFSDAMFPAMELSSSIEGNPYILIDTTKYTTSYKIKRQGKKEYIHFARIYVYNNKPK